MACSEGVWSGGSFCLLPPASVTGSPGPSFQTHSLLSSALWPGGVLHSHIPLPHAGGPVNSRGDSAWGSPRNSVLPVPKPHTSVGSPGKKSQMGLSCGSGGFPSVLLSGIPLLALRYPWWRRGSPAMCQQLSVVPRLVHSYPEAQECL